MKIQVSDCGPGIYPKDFDKLFKPYSKLKSGEQINPDGLGLGLFISKRIIEKLDGSITFKSKPKVKTTFEIKFKAKMICNLDTIENIGDMNLEHRDAEKDNKLMKLLNSGMTDSQANSGVPKDAVEPLQEPRMPQIEPLVED